MKNLLLLLLISILNADIPIPKETKQLLVVTAADFNSSIATLQAYERDREKWITVFHPISVNLGRNGLGWADIDKYFRSKKDEPLKYEGDGKAPAGLFSLDSFFGYEKREFNFPYLQVNENDICIDDIHSKEYNRLVKTQTTKEYKSFELMRRKDNLYELGILVGHNKKGIKKRGSCIFLHIQRDIDSPTSGCTSMSKPELLKLMQWLDYQKKPLLLQVPISKLDRF